MHALTWRRVADAIGDTGLAVLGVLLLPFVLLLLGAPFVLVGYAIAFIVRLF